MKKLLYTFLGTTLIIASCDGRGKKPENSQNSRPEDNYACNINTDGYCIFTGTPHNTGLQAGTDNITNRNGTFLFNINEAAAGDSSGEVLKATGKPAQDGEDMIKSSQEGLTNDEKSFHKVMAIMYPIRNALMYDIADLNQSKWDELITELQKRGIKRQPSLKAVLQKTTILEGKVFLIWPKVLVGKIYIMM